ncbi:unnamed protein product [Allacma fusca]|uniref:Uncharacterized protein n=1 Tax=Allacma fusca TaxID=39272 RepID=A0A8J2KH39_9HEXA|nr:unnamed protein product [Allacma fusca]
MASGGLNPEASSYLIPLKKSAGVKKKEQTGKGKKKRRRAFYKPVQLGLVRRRRKSHKKPKRGRAKKQNKKQSIKCVQLGAGRKRRNRSASPQEKDGRLKNELYYPNVTPEVLRASDPRWKARFDMSKKSQPFEVVGQLVGSIFTQPRYIPAGSHIRIVLRRAEPELCLECSMATKAGTNGVPYKYQITDAIFCGSKKVSKPIIDPTSTGMSP